MASPQFHEEMARLAAENERLRALWEKELKVYKYGVSERVRLKKELEQAEARIAALEALFCDHRPKPTGPCVVCAALATTSTPEGQR